MAKKEEEFVQNKPVEVRQQTEGEIRKRLRSQGKLPKNVKKVESGIHEVTDEEALIRMAERKERVVDDAKKKDPNVRLLTEKDVALRLSAAKKREAAKEKDGKKGKFLTKEDIDGRGKSGEVVEEEVVEETEEEVVEVVEEVEVEKKDKKKDKAPVSKESGEEPVEYFAKDIVSFKDDDGETVIGKIQRVTSKGEAIIDTEEAEYTVSCDLLTKEAD